MIELPETHSAMKLAAALDKADLTDMAAKARGGYYHDYLSPLDFPDLTLAEDLRRVSTPAAQALHARHLNGDFDATLEESDAWAGSVEGQAAFAALPDEVRVLFGYPTGSNR